MINLIRFGFVLFVLICNFFPSVLTAYRGRLTRGEGQASSGGVVPVYYPPYNPIDMEQFRSMKVLSEIERRIPMTLQEALKMVRRQKMQSCVALIICTLACDPKSQGAAGDEAYKQLIHFSHVTNNSTVKLPDHQLKDIALFRDAEAKGTSHRNNCDLCTKDYPRCRKQITDLLKMFLNFDISD